MASVHLLTVQRLKKGPRANILVGLEGDYFIGLAGVSSNLLAYHSPYAKQKLVDERATTLCIPNGYKKLMVWMYKYMQAGEKDPQGLQTFESLSFDDLSMLHKHASLLQYRDLMGRVVGRMKGEYKDRLPSVEELKVFKDAIPPLYEYAITVLADEMANLWACNYNAYLQYANEDSAFGEALGLAMKTLIAARVKRSEAYYTRFADRRDIALSTEYYEQCSKAQETAAASKATTKPAAKRTGTTGRTSKVHPATGEQITRPRRTHGSKNKPSIDSTATADNLARGSSSSRSSKTRESFKCYNCDGEGHMSRNCKAEPKAKKPAGNKEPFMCYNCNEEGHMSHGCPQPRAVREVRRSQRDPGAVLIDVGDSNGQIRTVPSPSYAHAYSIFICHDHPVASRGASHANSDGRPMRLAASSLWHVVPLSSTTTRQRPV
jgi:hypothetical protein